MEIKVDVPADWDMRVREGTDGLQISPLALMWIKEHINTMVYCRDHYDSKTVIKYDNNSAPQFGNSKQIKILEFGGGCSTIFFAKAFPYAQICTVEGEEDWYNKETSWANEDKLFNVRVIKELQPSDYGFDSPREDNMNYALRAKEFGFPFDLILNDGAMREKVADVILSDPDRWLSVGGVYLRHDYEKALDERWIGPHTNPRPLFVLGEVGTYYESFCATHPNYSMLTVPGNGIWGFYCEYGGIWRRK